MNALPPLRGTPKQVKWAQDIRAKTFQSSGLYPPALLKIVIKVDDATWWIANKETFTQRLMQLPKRPMDYQRVGGPPPPPRSTPASKRVEANQTKLRVGDEPETADQSCPESEPVLTVLDQGPDAVEQFAANVSKFPFLAEAAILVLAAKLCRSDYQREQAQRLKHRAKCKLDNMVESLKSDAVRTLASIKSLLES